jgi:hypothetical protein
MTKAHVSNNLHAMVRYAPLPVIPPPPTAAPKRSFPRVALSAIRANDPRQEILSKPGICAGLIGTEIKDNVEKVLIATRLNT